MDILTQDDGLDGILSASSSSAGERVRYVVIRPSNRKVSDQRRLGRAG